MDESRTISERLVTTNQGHFMDLMQLVRYPDYDSYTVGHSVRVAVLAVLVGQRMGLEDSFLVELCTASLLHDVGKSKIPEEILFKPGRLDDEERAVMEMHTRLGAEVLMEHESASKLAVAGAWGHHLCHDGSGYPKAPAWAVRSSVTALLQVCDVFEALTAIRPYKPPFTPRRAYEIMLSQEGSFNPSAITAFVQTMGLYPPGSQVSLTDGSRGMVLANSRDLEKPVVKLTCDPDGEILPPDFQPTVNLFEQGKTQVKVEQLLLDDGPIQSVPTAPVTA